MCMEEQSEVWCMYEKLQDRRILGLCWKEQLWFLSLSLFVCVCVQSQCIHNGK